MISNNFQKGRILTIPTTQVQSGLGSNGNEGMILHF